MSTGVDCRLYEKEPGKWFYDLGSYGDRNQHNTYGPFWSFRAAKDHLSQNHANPGGYGLNPLPGCKHDITRPVLHRIWNDPTHTCDRCGNSLDFRTPENRREESWQEALLHNPAHLILGKLVEGGITEKQLKGLMEAGIPQNVLDKVFASSKKLDRKSVV